MYVHVCILSSLLQQNKKILTMSYFYSIIIPEGMLLDCYRMHMSLKHAEKFN